MAASRPIELPAWERLPLLHCYLLLTALTAMCLLPFLGKAFHVDDTLFIKAAHQIAAHPDDPYGFDVIWGPFKLPMSEETKNPPLASYYMALAARVMGWSEAALHFAFFLPALALILGTYRLARKFTRLPLLAAAATLLTPGILVSATSVMCDVLMVTFWVWAIIFWMDGLEQKKGAYLLASALLITASALTKYFGVALIPLLLVYSVARERRFAGWAFYFLLPVAALTGYQFWTKALYGHGLLLEAAGFASQVRSYSQISFLSLVIVSLTFLGGCTLPALIFSSLLWSYKKALWGCAISVLAGLAMVRGWVGTTALLPNPEMVSQTLRDHAILLGIQIMLMVAAGISVFALATTDLWKKRSADSFLLASWMGGTFIFMAFLNWTINARSILPQIPAAAILLVRHLEGRQLPLLHSSQWFWGKCVAALVLCGALSLWITWGDVELANSAREAARIIQQKTRDRAGTLWFQGHWGFQHYMELAGAQPVDLSDLQFKAGDILVIPENNYVIGLPIKMTGEQEVIQVERPSHATTIQWRLSAGFYAAVWGAMPFAIGDVPPERYVLMTIAAVPAGEQSR